MVQIPCLNEESTLGEVIRGVPRKIEGADRVEVLVIDDGSADRSVEVAREAGADHVVRLKNTRGLARAFSAGIDAGLKLGADVIVNIDADGQYRPEDIGVVAAPVIAGRAEVVVGDRGIKDDPGYPGFKKFLQVSGSMTVRLLSGTAVKDATSGFRAMSREAALRLCLVSDFTYTLESLIQAGADRLRLESVPVESRPVARPSRLFATIPHYLARSVSTLVRIYSMYEPLKVFAALGTAIFSAGFAIGLWFLFYFVVEGGKGHVQLLILAAVLLIIGFQVLVMALVADLIGANRKLLSELLYRVKKLELDPRPQDGTTRERPGR